MKTVLDMAVTFTNWVWGIPMLIVIAGGRFFLAVQWHPEMMAAADPIQQRIITRFVQSCSW